MKLSVIVVHARFDDLIILSLSQEDVVLSSSDSDSDSDEEKKPAAAAAKKAEGKERHHKHHHHHKHKHSSSDAESEDEEKHHHHHHKHNKHHSPEYAFVCFLLTLFTHFVLSVCSCSQASSSRSFVKEEGESAS